MAHDKGSLDYKVINKNIRNILNARSELNNTVQVAMPFVKATTTIQLPEFLGEGNVGFTLGIHAINRDLNYEDIYSSQDGNMPLIGYTYGPAGETRNVYAFDPNKEVSKLIASVFDSRATLYSSTDFTRVPPPGITRVSVGRVKNGVLAQAQIDISVPSLAQLESLHRTFLIPGVGMVLEWGQQFAPEVSPSIGEGKNVSDYLFPWHNPTERSKLLAQLARKELGYQEILERSAYPSEGQYMWMFGRVANFTTKTSADGSFQCTVKIVGPSQDSWAYSVKNTVVPPKDGSTQFYCASKTTSVYTYFSDTATGGFNFKTLLDKVKNGTEPELRDWQNHVQFFTLGNKTEGNPTAQSQNPTTNQDSFADAQDAYFMTWRFFVNVVLNHEKHGLRGVFTAAGITPDVIKTIGLLLPYADGPTRSNTTVAKLATIDDPAESFVGMNDYLRSVDPSTLIIVNETAAQRAAANPQYNVPGIDVKILDKTEDSKMFTEKGIGTFDQSAEKYFGGDQKKTRDRGFLSTGVWINHKAVVESMMSADTIIRGISNLLERMNNATLNYWQLAVDDIEGEGPANYMVIDANFRDSSDKAVSKFIDDVHIFNKYVRQDNSTGKIVGSELLECNIDLSLPQRLFTQIATLGLVQRKDVAAAAQKELKVGDPVPKPQPNEPDYINSTAAKISDPNDALREMFAITTLSAKTKDGQGPDLTILPEAQRDLKKEVCGKANVQVPGALGGQGYQVANINLEESTQATSPNAEIAAASAKVLETEVCKKCAPCVAADITTSQTSTTTDTFFKEYPWSAAFVSYVMRTSGTPFSANSTHTGYAQALRGGSSGWQTLDPKTATLQPGDIIVNNRKGNNMTYNTNPWVGYSHGDIVVRSEGGKVTAVGGNLSNAVNLAYYQPTNNSGIVVLRPPASSVTTVTRVALDEYQKWEVNKWKETNPAAVSTLNQYYATVGLGPVPGVTAPAGPPPTTCSDSKYAEIGGTVEAGKEACNKCRKHTEIVNQVAASAQTSVQTAQRNFYGMQRAFRYVEIFPDYMVASIAASADGVFANAFGASPASLSISGDLVMPGIAGFRVGELFWIDRVPTFYKAFGAFQILSLEDTIDTTSWKTSIHARFNYLGKTWKESMAKKLGVR